MAQSNDRPVPSSILVLRGVRALRHFLLEQTCDLRGLDLTGFRRWLEHHLARWRNDPVFVRRVQIRDLRRTHPELRALEEAHRRAAAADAASPSYAHLHRLGKALADADKAVAGLTEALKQATPLRQPAMRQKLAAFKSRRMTLRDEQKALVLSSPERQALLRISAELEQLHFTTGLDREQARLGKLLKEQGQRSGRAGATFERLALTLTQRHIVPDLRRGGAEGGAKQRWRVLRGVTLGAARIEFDQLVIRGPRDGSRPVEVLAAVEVKRNINDVSHGFRRRQGDLTWLTGDTAHYDPAQHRTRHFPSGHFDREVVHEQEGESFVFVRSSFRRFRREPATGHFLNRLYFITRPGNLWGVSGAALARIGFRIATDEHWQPDEDGYLRTLLRWCQSLAEPVETPDVLLMYSATTRLGRQILMAGR